MAFESTGFPLHSRCRLVVQRDYTRWVRDSASAKQLKKFLLQAMNRFSKIVRFRPGRIFSSEQVLVLFGTELEGISMLPASTNIIVIRHEVTGVATTEWKPPDRSGMTFMGADAEITGSSGIPIC